MTDTAPTSATPPEVRERLARAATLQRVFPSAYSWMVATLCSVDGARADQLLGALEQNLAGRVAAATTGAPT